MNDYIQSQQSKLTYCVQSQESSVAWYGLMPKNVYGHILGNDYIVGKAENRASLICIVDSAISYT